MVKWKKKHVFRFFDFQNFVIALEVQNFNSKKEVFQFPVYLKTNVTCESLKHLLLENS